MRSSIIRDHYLDTTRRSVPEPSRATGAAAPAGEYEVGVEAPSVPTWVEIWTQEAEAAEEIIGTARFRADAVLAAAEIQAEEIERQARVEGHAEGYAAGYAEGLAHGEADGYAQGLAKGQENGEAAVRAEGVEILHRATQIASAAQLDREQLIQTAEAQLVDLAIAVARKVIQAELATDPTLVRQCVQAALRAIGDSPLAVLHLNPEDIELLQDVWTELRQRFGEGGLQIVPDARIQRGGCIVDTEARTVDAQIESRLAEIERRFRRIGESQA